MLTNLENGTLLMLEGLNQDYKGLVIITDNVFDELYQVTICNFFVLNTNQKGCFRFYRGELESLKKTGKTHTYGTIQRSETREVSFRMKVEVVSL